MAKWMAAELKGNQDPTIRLGWHGGVASYTKCSKVTFLSTYGVLVQMFQPFKLTDLKQLDQDIYISQPGPLFIRAAEILEITPLEAQVLSLYLNKDSYFSTTVRLLRTLK